MKESEKKELLEIDKDLQALKEYLNTNSIDGDEYDVIVGQLVETMDKLKAKRRLSQLKKIGLALTIVFFFFFFLFQVSWFHKIFAVIGRLFLLEMLPWWDWTKIYYSDCILTNPFYLRKGLTDEDCKLCTPLDTLERLHDMSPKMVWNEYLINDRPFIMVDGMTNWTVMNVDNFWFDNITETYLSQDTENVEVCEFETNLRIVPNDHRSFLHIIHDPNTWNWFGHWENCAKKGAKALRAFYQRPYFIPSLVDLSEPNWVLMSSNYQSKYFLQLDYNTELLLVAQMRGWNRIRLTPREPCTNYCPQFVDTLTEGQILVLTNFMWELEYIPGENTDNLAIGIGGDWN